MNIDSRKDHKGKVLETKDIITITLNHFDQEPKHQRLAEFAAERINDAQPATNNGKRVIIQVAEY